MPGNPGYLGVCFGTVITANSPAAHPGHPVNWQAVLWHEFCHVVTLQKTRNKMPRWLSEGISVYEEGRSNPTWGQRMNPRYREMVLDDELTPVSKLSAAFLAPRSDLHLQFAYYESSLVVEFIVERFGLDALKAVLNDLGAGLEINQALAKRTAPMETIDRDFAAFARTRAEQLAPGMDWEKPAFAESTGGRRRPGFRVRLPGASDTNAPAVEKPLRLPGRSAGDEVSEFIAAHPTNYYALTEQARRLVDAKKLEEAKAPLELLLKLYPTQNGPDSAWAMLAAVYRALGETNAERGTAPGNATPCPTVRYQARLRARPREGSKGATVP